MDKEGFLLSMKQEEKWVLKYNEVMEFYRAGAKESDSRASSCVLPVASDKVERAYP